MTYDIFSLTYFENKSQNISHFEISKHFETF